MQERRFLTLTDSTSYMFSSIVGSGVFFTTGYILTGSQNPWTVLLLWVMGGIFAMTGALTYAGSAVIFPKAGGDYVYLREAYSPLIAFLNGWSSLTVNFSASISILSVAFAKYFFFFLPDKYAKWYFFQSKFFGLNISLGFTQLGALAAVYLFTFIGYFGVKSAFRIQNLLTAVKVTGLAIFILAGFIFGANGYSQIFSQSIVGGITELFSWKSIASGIVPVTFSYFGWNMVTYIAGEVKDPSKTIPRSILISTIMAGGVYLLINFVFFLSAPLSSLQGKEGIGIVASRNLFGDWAVPVVTGFICWIILGSLSAMIIGGSRIYFAMAKDGLFFRSLSEFHPKHHSLYKALLFQAFYATLFILIQELESLLYLATCSILFLSNLTAATPYIFAKRGIVGEYKIPGYPVTPIIFIATNSLIITIMLLEKPFEALWGLGIVMLGIPVYYLFKKNFKSSE